MVHRRVLPKVLNARGHVINDVPAPGAVYRVKLNGKL